MADRPPTKRHGEAAQLSPQFMQLLEALGNYIDNTLPEGKSFALFVIHHPSHEVSLISEHSPNEVAGLLSDWFDGKRKPHA